MSKIPTTVHRKQLSTDASVKGSGMDSADFVETTVLRAARGDPNMATHKTTPKFPTNGAGLDKVRAIPTVNNTNATQP